jgi:hypothetical protein
LGRLEDCHLSRIERCFDGHLLGLGEHIMKAQVMLRGGPWDMHLLSYDFIGDFPTEIRVGSADKATAIDEDSFHAGVYRYVDSEDMPVSLMKFAAYQFMGMRKTTHALVNVWVT